MEIVVSLTRRRFLATAAAASVAPTPSFAAYPDQELVWLIYQSPGGTVDVSTRIVQPYMEKAGFKVRLEYATGAGGRIARNKLFAAKPDGYTVMTEVAPGAIVDELAYSVPYKADSFEPIYGWSSTGFQYCVRSDSPIKTFADLVAETKKRRVTFASIGRGGAQHLHIVSMRKKLGLSFDIVHFDGASPAYAAVLGGHVDVGGGGPASGRRQGGDRLRFLAVTSDAREFPLDEVPTLKELGYNVPPGQSAVLRQHVARRPRRPGGTAAEDRRRRSRAAGFCREDEDARQFGDATHAGAHQGRTQRTPRDDPRVQRGPQKMSVEPVATDRNEIGAWPHAIGSAVLATIGLIGFALILLETGTFSPEARPFPRLIAIVGLLGAAVALAQSCRVAFSAQRFGRASNRDDAGPAWHSIAVSYTAPPIYGALLLALGFWVASLIFLTGLLAVLGERRPAVIGVIAGGTLGAIYLVFEMGFSIRLPGSLLLQALGT